MWFKYMIIWLMTSIMMVYVHNNLLIDMYNAVYAQINLVNDTYDVVYVYNNWEIHKIEGS